MNRRYFVTYKHWDGSATKAATHVFGRFFGQDAAEQQARERYGSLGYELLGVRPETEFEAARYKIFRFLVRCLRIAIGVAIAFVAYAWLGNSDSNTGNIPLGDLTFNMIFSALLHGAIFIGLAWLCWIIAFGDGPQDDR